MGRYIWTNFSQISPAQRETDLKAEAFREWRYLNTLYPNEDESDDDPDDDPDTFKYGLEDVEKRHLERYSKYPDSRFVRVEFQTGSGVSKNDIMLAAWLNEVRIRDLVPEDLAFF